MAAGYYVSEDILAEILKRLAVKSLLRFRCVKKSWYFLVHSSHFITLHSNYQKSPSNKNKYLLQLYDSKSLSIGYDDETCDVYYSAELPSSEEQPMSYGISNGLICFSEIIKKQHRKMYYYEEKITIWNPAVRKCLTLPRPECTTEYQDYYGYDPVYAGYYKAIQITLGIGFVSKFNDYKVVKIMQGYSMDYTKKAIIEVDVYSLSSNSWKTISLDGLYWKNWCSSLVFVDGAAFSIGWDDKGGMWMCIYLDLENAVARNILLPEHYPCFSSSVRAYGGSLALFHKDQHLKLLTMWVMEEDFSWTKKSTVTMTDINIIGVRNNGMDLVMLFNYRDIAFYNAQKQERKEVVLSSNMWNHFNRQWGTVHPYTETLIGLNTFFDYKKSTTPAIAIDR